MNRLIATAVDCRPIAQERVGSRTIPWNRILVEGYLHCIVTIVQCGQYFRFIGRLKTCHRNVARQALNKGRSRGVLNFYRKLVNGFIAAIVRCGQRHQVLVIPAIVLEEYFTRLGNGGGTTQILGEVVIRNFFAFTDLVVRCCNELRSGVIDDCKERR